MNQIDYLDAIKVNHCLVSFSSAKQVFYISLWNGVLRDGKVDDIDFHFIEAYNPTIFNHSLSFEINNQNKNIILSKHQLKHLYLLFITDR
jgi:hypothetical protein